MAAMRHQGLPKLDTCLCTDFKLTQPSKWGCVLNAFGKPAPRFSIYLGRAEARGVSLESHFSV